MGAKSISQVAIIAKAQGIKSLLVSQIHRLFSKKGQGNGGSMQENPRKTQEINHEACNSRFEAR